MTDRATLILTAYDLLPDPKDDIRTMLFEVMDSGLDDRTPVHRLIRDSFQSDDDFDDLQHEIEHALGDCHDGDLDCPWSDDEQE